MKDKTTTALLAFFLGGLGIHHFYLGNGGKGVLYLIFCWTLIPAIIAFVESIIFFFMSDQEFNSRYNSGINRNYNQQNIYNNPSHVNVSEEIEKLYKLKQQGALTEDEFNYRKRKLLL